MQKTLILSIILSTLGFEQPLHSNQKLPVAAPSQVQVEKENFTNFIKKNGVFGTQNAYGYIKETYNYTKNAETPDLEKDVEIKMYEKKDSGLYFIAGINLKEGFFLGLDVNLNRRANNPEEALLFFNLAFQVFQSMVRTKAKQQDIFKTLHNILVEINGYSTVNPKDIISYTLRIKVPKKLEISFEMKLTEKEPSQSVSSTNIDGPQKLGAIIWL